MFYWASTRLEKGQSTVPIHRAPNTIIIIIIIIENPLRLSLFLGLMGEDRVRIAFVRLVTLVTLGRLV